MPRPASLLYCVLCAMLAGAPAAFACATPQEAQMFDVAGLKSELMVTAISCNADSQYNAFVTRFRPELLADDHELGAYFRHKYGRAGQAAHDSYTTNIANKMSEKGVAQGTEFCRRHLALFSEVLGLKDVSELRLFAVSRGYLEPVAPARCRMAGSARAEVATRQR